MFIILNWLKKQEGLNYYTFENVALKDIRVSGIHGTTFLPRKLEPIIKAYKAGSQDALPRISIWRIDGQAYLSDGQHRTAVRAKNQFQGIPAIVTNFPECPIWFNPARYNHSVGHLVDALPQT
jgi:hypothetical protein